MMKLKYSESPFLTINLLENQEYSLEDDVLGQILEFYSEMKLTQRK